MDNLYYGTTTNFLNEIKRNGIQAPSNWGTYEYALLEAEKAADRFGGDPMVIDMNTSDMSPDHILQEDNKDYFVYTETFYINLERKSRKIFENWNKFLKEKNED